MEVMSDIEITHDTLDALAQASGANIEPGLLSQIQASVESIVGLDELDLKDVQPAITFSTSDTPSGARS